MLMSRASKDTSPCSGKLPFPVLRGSVVIVCNGLLKFRIAEREQWPPLQLHGKEPEPQTAEPKNRGQVPQVRQCHAGKFRTRKPIKIEDAHGDHPRRDNGNQSLVAFYLVRKQYKERQEEVQ